MCVRNGAASRGVSQTLLPLCAQATSVATTAANESKVKRERQMPTPRAAHVVLGKQAACVATKSKTGACVCLVAASGSGCWGGSSNATAAHLLLQSYRAALLSLRRLLQPTHRQPKAADAGAAADSAELRGV